MGASEGLVGDLRAQLARGQALVVVGAGVSVAASGASPVASWPGLLESGVQWCERYEPSLPAGWADLVRGFIGLGDVSSLLSAAEAVTERLGGRGGGEYHRWLRETVGALPLADAAVAQAVAALGAPVATTNYDGLLEQAMPGTGTLTWRDGARIQRVLRGDEKAVLHLHGYWDEPESVVLGIRSYEAVLGDAAAQALQRAMGSLSSLVLVGVG
ncbi:MAG: SIR2 family protein, partial [Candidatus Dormibacteraeota bacterium]|nr:SIR2 family protein [Candidatus Dormibacteraeota bacterium]